jgi:hypothetical protein
VRHLSCAVLHFGDQDIEETIENDGRLRPGCSAAFSVPVDSTGKVMARTTGDTGDVEEGLVVVAEVRNDKVICFARHRLLSLIVIVVSAVCC